MDLKTDTLLFHNPNCSKSRAALALLEARGIPVTVIDYQRLPPAEDTLAALAMMVEGGAASLIRDGEPAFAATGISSPSAEPKAVFAAIAATPTLLQRPIFVHRGRAVVGRPPEAVLELL